MLLTLSRLRGVSYPVGGQIFASLARELTAVLLTISSSNVVCLAGFLLGRSVVRWLESNLTRCPFRWAGEPKPPANSKNNIKVMLLPVVSWWLGEVGSYTSVQ
ncbi:hypothetical protein VTK56DRAFT_9825 [Thermocarpiscus australiensis]